MVVDGNAGFGIIELRDERVRFVNRQGAVDFIEEAIGLVFCDDAVGCVIGDTVSGALCGAIDNKFPELLWRQEGSE